MNNSEAKMEEECKKKEKNLDDKVRIDSVEERSHQSSHQEDNNHKEVHRRREDRR